jgi:radical SAM-linked protein
MVNVRAFFEKGDSVKFISHLDLNRCFQRAIKRSGLPVGYSEGFNPHPYIVFSPPLSLGYIGLNEIIDFRLNNEIDLEQVKERLNASLPLGIRISKVITPKLKLSDTAFAEYRVKASGNVSLESLENLIKLPEIKVIKRSKKTQTELDLKPIFDEIHFEKRENGFVFNAILPSNGNLSINPTLLIEAIKNYTNEEVSLLKVKRIHFLDKDKNDFA